MIFFNILYAVFLCWNTTNISLNLIYTEFVLGYLSMQHYNLSVTAIVIWITSALKMDSCFHLKRRW